MRGNFDRALAEILRFEGGFVNDPRDPARATNLGITLATARAYHLDIDRDGDVDIDDIRKITPAAAAPVYRRGYWQAIGGDALPSGVDLIAFDAAVNHGSARAREWLRQTAALTPVARIADLAARRMALYRAQPAWDRFGRGWTRRVNEVAAMAKLWASRGAE